MWSSILVIGQKNRTTIFGEVGRLQYSTTAGIPSTMGSCQRVSSSGGFQIDIDPVVFRKFSDSKTIDDIFYFQRQFSPFTP